MTTQELMRFDDQVAIVTGGGGSLGGAYARLLASRGAKIIVNDLPSRDGGQDAADVTVAAITQAGGTAVAVTGDAVENTKEMVDAAVDTWGRLDMVIANAGAAIGGEIGDIEPAQFEATAAIAYKGATRLLHHSWGHLKQRRGRAVLTCSSSIFGGRYMTPYTSSKSTMIGLCTTLGLDGEPYGIRVNAIMPTARSAMMSGMPDPAFNEFIDSYYTAEHVANVVGWLLHDSTEVNGHIYTAGAGFAGRVVLGVGWGWGHQEATLEDYRAHAHEVSSLDGGIRVPADAGDEINFRSDRALGFHVDSALLH